MHNHDLYFGLAAILVFAIVALAFGAYSAEKKMNDYTPPPPPPPPPPIPASRPVFSDPDDPDDPIGPAGPVRVLPCNDAPWWKDVLCIIGAVLFYIVYLALQLLPYALMVLGLVVVVRWLV